MDNQKRSHPDDAKTAAEHSAIILHFLQTGELNRDDAQLKFAKFNMNHPEYLAAIQAENELLRNSVPFDQLSNRDMVYNLNKQLIFLGCKSLLQDS